MSEEDVTRDAEIDADLAAFRAVNNGSLYPFRKKEFVAGFIAGRLSVYQTFVAECDAKVNAVFDSIPGLERVI